MFLKIWQNLPPLDLIWITFAQTDCMTPNDLLTRQDLEDFKKELFEMLAPLTGSQTGAVQKWLKNEDLKRLLRVSGNTIQNMRVSGALPFSKIGGIHFYKQEDVDKMLAGAEKKSPKRSK